MLTSVLGGKKKTRKGGCGSLFRKGKKGQKVLGIFESLQRNISQVFSMTKKKQHGTKAKGKGKGKRSTRRH